MEIAIPMQYAHGGIMGNDSNSAAIIRLISEFRNGDENAFLELFLKYKPLIESSVASIISDEQYGIYAEDLFQEAAMVFCNSVMTYDIEQQEVEFGLYAKICISNALISQVRRLRRIRAERFSDTSDKELFAHDSEDPAVRILEQERLRSLYSVIRGSLSRLEYDIWQMYVSGRTAKQIGTLIGKDEKAVNNAIYRIRKKLRALLHNNN
jgi:RNA polymerase sporulation-specific sigma factor